MLTCRGTGRALTANRARHRRYRRLTRRHDMSQGGPAHDVDIPSAHMLWRDSTWRRPVIRCARRYPVANFGAGLALTSPTDRTALLMSRPLAITIVDRDGTEHRCELVVTTGELDTPLRRGVVNPVPEAMRIVTGAARRSRWLVSHAGNSCEIR